MKLGSLFSGGGLGDFGFLAAGMEIAWQCEIDEYCQKILALRYPESKKYRDIKTLKGGELAPVDIITGGFPCQPFSVAGKQKGKEDNRYLWPEMLRVIRECRPRWVIGENVTGIINLALDTVCNDLEAEGYEVWPVIFPAHALGAWHKRDRIWLIANASGKRLSYGGCDERQHENHIPEIREPQEDQQQRDQREHRSSEICTPMADTLSSSERAALWQGDDCWGTNNQQDNGNILGSDLRNGCEKFRQFWSVEPPVGRVANGIADRVHRLKMLGNGQVPACTYVIGKMIMEIEKEPRQ